MERTREYQADEKIVTPDVSNYQMFRLFLKFNWNAIIPEGTA